MGSPRPGRGAPVIVAWLRAFVPCDASRAAPRRRPVPMDRWTDGPIPNRSRMERLEPNPEERPWCTWTGTGAGAGADTGGPLASPRRLHSTHAFGALAASAARGRAHAWSGGVEEATPRARASLGALLEPVELPPLPPLVLVHLRLTLLLDLTGEGARVRWRVNRALVSSSGRVERGRARLKDRGELERCGRAARRRRCDRGAQPPRQATRDLDAVGSVAQEE